MENMQGRIDLPCILSIEARIYDKNGGNGYEESKY